MRPIKFRAFDANKMYYGVGILNGVIYTSQGKKLRTTKTLMQFTGLHDKNGKEIYEGDIVMRNKYTVASGRQEMVGPYEITWDNNKAGFEYKTEGYTAGLFYDVHEVIGNIYEHPELLNS